MSEGVWIVPRDVWMGSEGVWGCIATKSVGTNSYIVYASSDIAFSSSALPYAKIYIWGCLEGVWGVWIVSGSYLRVSGRCLWVYRCHIN